MFLVCPFLSTVKEEGVTVNSQGDAVSSLDVSTYIWLYGSNVPIFCLLMPAMNRSLNQSRIPCIDISWILLPAIDKATPRRASVKNRLLPHTAKLSGFKLIPYSPGNAICLPKTSGILTIEPPPTESLIKFFSYRTTDTLFS